MVTPLKEDAWWSVFLAVPSQELFRFLFWKLLKRAENGMNIVGVDNGHIITHEKIAFVSGVGYGSMSVAINFNIVLSSSSGPGTLTAPGCEGVSFFAVSAMIAMVFGILNICWSVIAHSGFEGRHASGKLFGWNGIKIVFVIASHYFASYLTLNQKNGGSCAGTLVPLYVLMAVTVLCAYRVSGVSFVSK